MAHIPGVLAAELVGGNQIALYTRGDSHTQAFSPWLLVETPEDAQRAGLAGVSNCVRLKGGGEFRTRLHFPHLVAFSRSARLPRQDGIPHFNFNNPVRQHLALSGQTLFAARATETSTACNSTSKPSPSIPRRPMRGSLPHLPVRFPRL